VAEAIARFSALESKLDDKCVSVCPAIVESRDARQGKHGCAELPAFQSDENNSNRWQDVLEVTNRAWVAERYQWDDHLAPDGRVPTDTDSFTARLLASRRTRLQRDKPSGKFENKPTEDETSEPGGQPLAAAVRAEMIEDLPVVREAWRNEPNFCAVWVPSSLKLDRTRDHHRYDQPSSRSSFGNSRRPPKRRGRLRSCGLRRSKVPSVITV
jgi:D-xylulose 5-phosphate/D-fructose 6-phosphate phosphoketolase